MQRVQERLTQVATKLLFFDLEWAALPDAHVDELLADPRLDFAAHHLRSLRRYRDHLLTEPEEIILTEKSVTGDSAWSRLFDEQTSAITVEIDGEATSLELGLSRLMSPDAAVRARRRRRRSPPASSPGCAPAPSSSTPCSPTSRPTTACGPTRSWVSSRNLGNEASDESVAALVEAVVNRYSIPQRWYTAKARMLGVDQLDDWDRYASVATDTATVRLGRRLRHRPRLVPVVLPRHGRRRRPVPRPSRGSTRRCGRPSAAARSAPTPCRRTTRT